MGLSDQEFFAANGYLILREFYNPQRDFNNITQEIAQLFDIESPCFDPFASYTDGLDELARRRAYSGLRYLPSLFQFASNNANIDIAKQFGLRVPALMHSCNIRMDLPNRNEFMFHWHQDITYLLGSMNALTFWVPLTKVSRADGTIELIPGSHLNGVKPIRFTGSGQPQKGRSMSPKDIFLIDEPFEDSIFVEAMPGDLVVFSQLLLHRSSPNCSDRIRWTIQLRYADFSEPRFIENNYPMGDSSNIFYTDYMGLKND